MSLVFDQFFTWLCWFAAGATTWIALGYLVVRSLRRRGETADRSVADASSSSTPEAGRMTSPDAGNAARPASLLRRTVFAAGGAVVVLLAMNAVAGHFIGLAMPSGVGPNATVSCRTCNDDQASSETRSDSQHAPATNDTGHPGLLLAPIPDPQRSQEAPEHAVQSL